MTNLMSDGCQRTNYAPAFVWRWRFLWYGFDILASSCTDENTKERRQECICGVIQKNSCVRCVHLSQVKEPLVSMSANCWEVFTYLMWILGSRFILSNNQSRFTRWVREICLKDGLRPFMIILITTSYYSKPNKAALWLEMCEFGRIDSILSVSILSAMRDFVLWRLMLCMSHKMTAGTPFQS